jgi:hypothetical protein
MSFPRVSVEKYHRMIQHEIITEEDRVELLEGRLVKKEKKTPPHRFATQTLRDQLLRMLPQGWFADTYESLTTADSEPEFDLAIFRGVPRAFAQENRHPGPEDTAVVIEVAHTTLDTDDGPKKRIYARADIAEYWIVNLVDRRVEVYTEPTGPCDAPTYNARRDFAAGDEVPVHLDGHEIGRVPVNDLFV